MPSEEDWLAQVEKAAHNLSLSLLFMKYKILAICAVEAIALLTGGEVPISLFMLADSHLKDEAVFAEVESFEGCVGQKSCSNMFHPFMTFAEPLGPPIASELSKSFYLLNGKLAVELLRTCDGFVLVAFIFHFCHSACRKAHFLSCCL